MTWKINFTKSADKDFSKLTKNIQARIVFYIKEKVFGDVINPDLLYKLFQD